MKTYRKEHAVKGQVFITIEWFNAFKGSNSGRRSVVQWVFCTQCANWVWLYNNVLMRHGCNISTFSISYFILKNKYAKQRYDIGPKLPNYELLST